MNQEKEKGERKRYLDGLRRYSERGIPIYMDGKLSEPEDWEQLFELREDGRFYMGDYVQTEEGRLKEIRFDRVYLSEENGGRGRNRRREGRDGRKYL